MPYPEVIFDPAQRRCYHLREGLRIWHEVPPGFEFDESGHLRPTGESGNQILFGVGMIAAESGDEIQLPPSGGMEAIEEESNEATAVEPAEKEPGQKKRRPAEVKHGRSD